MKTKDLDVLVPEDREVTFGGAKYILPGDLPLEIFLRLNNLGDEDEDDGSAATTMIAIIGDLFAWEAPEAAKEAISQKVAGVVRGRGVKNMLTMVENIYKDEEEDVEPEADETPTPEAAGTQS